MKKYKWLALLSLTFILLTLSKGVIIALIITFLIYFSNIKLLRRSTKYILFATIFIAFFLYIYINYYPSVFEQIYNRFGYHSVGIRYDIIVESIRLIQNKPIIGYGGGIIYSDIIGTNINVTATHNTFIQQIIYFGIPIGIILSFSLLYLFIHFLILARQNRHNEIFYRARTIAIVILGQLIIFLTESSFEGSVLRLIFYFSIASFVSLISATKRELSL